ncbi:MAG: maleylpyruvate isomerase family mycothiol-dependent enzyme [Pseudomonadales bacterium]|nr:maleylpyruvate isomerase family mycothiol-dependent enzyme [Pseudomonadales bacterium]
MKARMLATARQMETWAHGWEIYDLMGVARTHSDRLRNIAEIGVRTFGWAFKNRDLEVPEDIPYVELTSPSGAKWQWHDPSSVHTVSGDVVDFCQVVTQVRNVADTQLRVTGDNAIAWMRIAQCFAGPPEDPPPQGSRVRSQPK